MQVQQNDGMAGGPDRQVKVLVPRGREQMGAKACPTCDGKGVVLAIKRSTFKATVRCETCGGSGKVTPAGGCHACGGSGSVPLGTDNEGESFTTACNACGGTGKVGAVLAK